MGLLGDMKHETWDGLRARDEDTFKWDKLGLLGTWDMQHSLDLSLSQGNRHRQGQVRTDRGGCAKAVICSIHRLECLGDGQGSSVLPEGWQICSCCQMSGGCAQLAM